MKEGFEGLPELPSGEQPGVNHDAAAALAGQGWSENYVSDAATKLVKRHWRGRTYETSNYDPPNNGVHLCGQHADGEQPYTAASYAMQSDQARRLFELAKAHAETSRDEGDFVVDLVVAGDIVDDFWTSRQVWPRAIEAWNDADVRPA